MPKPAILGNLPAELQSQPSLKVDIGIPEQDRSVLLLHAAFERRAAHTPNAVAVEYSANTLESPRHLTYGVMNQQANQIAEQLASAAYALSQGWKTVFRNQRVVPLFLPGSPEFYIGAISVMKAGMAFCPLPLDVPAHRLIDILDDVAASVVLGIGCIPFPGVNLESLSDGDKQRLQSMIWVDITDGTPQWHNSEGEDSLAKSISSGSTSLHNVGPSPDDLAYILYTSGSTGKPKGVLISHSMAATAICAHAEAFEPLPSGADLRWLQFGMPTFDLTILEIFLTLSYGGVLCVANRALILSNIERAINVFKINTLLCVATMATLIRPGNVPTLRNIISGGEALTKYSIDNFSCDSEACKPPKRLINVYGPTEATFNNTASITRIGYRGSIAGPPLKSCTIHIVDHQRADELVQMPMGLSGEIVLAGPLVGYGYLNRPVESAAAFVSGLGHDRAYRTGDRGRIVWSEDGRPHLEVLGRLSMEQVKLNARRVELGDIESTIINQVPEAKEIATIVLDKSFLAAYVSLNGDDNQTDDIGYQQHIIAKCRASAENGLPDWMRPVFYHILPAIPRNTSGKTDRKTLQADAEDRFGSSITTRPTPAGNDSRSKLPPLDLGNSESVRSNVKFALELVLGFDVLSDPAISLQSAGLDSLRAMKFLQEARQLGMDHLGMDVVLAAENLDDLVRITIEEGSRNFNGADVNGLSHSADNDDELIELEDEEQLLELTLSQKLKHFSATCGPQCVEKVGIPASEIAQILPATALHVRGFALLTEAEALGVSKPWTEHWLYEVPEHINIARLEQSIITTVKKYDAFRSMFVEVEHPLSPFAICILSADSPHALHDVVKIQVKRFSTCPKSAWQQQLVFAQRAAEEMLGLNGLCGVTTIVQSEDEKHRVLIFSSLHAIYDGMSFQNLAKDIFQVYHGQEPVGAEGRYGLMAPVKRHYSADWLSATLHWSMKLGGTPIFKTGSRQLGSIFVRDATHFDYVGIGTGYASLSLKAKLNLQQLIRNTRQHGLGSPTSVAQAAWSMTLARTLATEQIQTDLDVQFAGGSHGRQTPDSLDVFAMMVVGTLARVIFPKSQRRTHRQICNDLYSQHVENAPHMEAPCPSVQFARTTRRFDSSVILQVLPKSKPSMAEISAAGFPVFNRTFDKMTSWRETNALVPLLLEIWPDSEGDDASLALRCTYSETWPGYEFMTTEWIKGVLVTFDQALHDVACDPDTAFNPFE